MSEFVRTRDLKVGDTIATLLRGKSREVEIIGVTDRAHGLLGGTEFDVFDPKAEEGEGTYGKILRNTSRPAKRISRIDESTGEIIYP
jgi:hypothetical protein